MSTDGRRRRAGGRLRRMRGVGEQRRALELDGAESGPQTAPGFDIAALLGLPRLDRGALADQGENERACGIVRREKDDLLIGPKGIVALRAVEPALGELAPGAGK